MIFIKIRSKSISPDQSTLPLPTPTRDTERPWKYVPAHSGHAAHRHKYDKSGVTHPGSSDTYATERVTQASLTVINIEPETS